MYEQYWGLQRSPFESHCDTSFAYRSQTHQTALLKMRYVLEGRLGAGMLVGGTGCGKTFLGHLLAAEVPERFGPFVHVVFPRLSADELLSYLATQLGAEEPGDGLDRTLRALEGQLAWHAEHNCHPVLLIDDAHLIDDSSVFETLQLLLNFQQTAPAAFSLLLVGDRTLLA
ncbi:MAG: ExeA family protein, partial [Planctomycetaceae bacterium]